MIMIVYILEPLPLFKGRSGLQKLAKGGVRFSLKMERFSKKVGDVRFFYCLKYKAAVRTVLVVWEQPF